MKKNTTTFSVAALALVAVLLIGMIFAARPPQQQTIAAQQPDGTVATFPPPTYLPFGGTFPPFPTYTPTFTRTPTVTPVPSGSTLVVTKYEDTDDGKCDADCSLREAIAVANASQDTIITFAQGLTGVFHVNAPMVISKHVSIVSSLSKSSGIILEMQNNLHTFKVELQGSLLADRLTLTRSEEYGEYGGGGGIINYGNAHIRNCTFVRTKGGSGGAVENYGTVLVQGSLFINNRATGGGAIAVMDGVVTIENSTFYENTATVGGAVWVASGEALVVNSTLYAAESQNNFELVAGNNTKISLKNSIFYVPRDGVPSAGFYPDGKVVNLGGNLLSLPGAERIPGEVFIGDPLLGPLVDNGGPTLTMALNSDSPAIGLGQSCPQLDQRGVVGSSCDAGAYQTNADLSRETK